MRLGPGLLYEGRTLQGARPKLADFCSATMAEFYSAVDIYSSHDFLTDRSRSLGNQDDRSLVSLLTEQIEFADAVILNKSTDAGPDKTGKARFFNPSAYVLMS
ncbi:hypothetical protein [Donghicola sp. XS_ASV15]|uniref:hypothetical protein n=1 Tax=Donghicola sp. XS_ASV15 TaxID=3241295 RepID=UPI0035138069